MKYLTVVGSVVASFALSIVQVLILPPGWLVIAGLLHNPWSAIPMAAFAVLVVWQIDLFEALTKAWLIQLGCLTAPLVVPFIMQRVGDSVRWRIYNTLDDPGQNQGMNLDKNGKPVPGLFEQTVQDIFDACGWRWKTWYWLCGRNVCYGLANRLRPVYDFSTIKFTVSGPAQGIQRIDAAWMDGAATEYRLFLKANGAHIALGYKLAESYLDSAWPEIKINPSIDTNPETDVGGVPFLTVRLK